MLQSYLYFVYLFIILFECFAPCNPDMLLQLLLIGSYSQHISPRLCLLVLIMLYTSILVNSYCFVEPCYLSSVYHVSILLLKWYINVTINRKIMENKTALLNFNLNNKHYLWTTNTLFEQQTLYLNNKRYLWTTNAIFEQQTLSLNNKRYLPATLPYLIF